MQERTRLCSFFGARASVAHGKVLAEACQMDPHLRNVPAKLLANLAKASRSVIDGGS